MAGGSRKGLEDVAAPANAAVADDLDPSAHGIGDRGDEVEGGRRAVELTAAVVRQGDGVHAGVGGELRVGDGLHALEDDGAVPHRPEPVDVRPRQRRVELGVDVVRQGDRGGAVADVTTDDVGEADRLAARERPGPARMERSVDDRARTDGGREREPAADVTLDALYCRERRRPRP
jgi:hypothetical protein